MRLTFYWDLLFILNFSVCCFSLWITADIIREKSKYIRRILGAGWNSLLFLWSIFHPYLLHGWIGAIFWIGVTAGTILIAFGRKHMLRNWFYSTTAMFLIGSIMLFIKEKCLIDYLTPGKWCLLCLGGVLILVLIRLYWKEKESVNKCIGEMVLEQSGCQVVIKTFFDTGNLLKDPLTGKSVVIIQSKIVKRCVHIYAKQIIELYEKNGQMDMQLLMKREIGRMGFHLIPFQSLGNPAGTLLVLYIQKIRIPELQLTLERQPVAIAPDSLFDGKQYQAIINEKAF